MSMNDRTHHLPENVSLKLRLIRRRAIATTLFRGLFLTGAILLGCVLAAMLLDLGVGWFSHAARYAVAIAAMSAAAAALVGWCLLPLFRHRSLVATAREVDQSLPELEERWSTVTEFSQNQDAPEVRGSEALIRQVGTETDRVSDRISPAAVVSARPMSHAAGWLALSAAACGLFFAVNFGQARLLLERFLMPGRDISLTHVTALPADGWSARGEPLTLRATLEGRIPASAPHLFLKADGGATRELSMSATESGHSFQYRLPEVPGSFEYRIRAGDGQSPKHRITAVDRPLIQAIQLKVSPPAYSGLPVEEKTALPPTVRVLQGSEVSIAFQSDQPLDRMILDAGGGQSIRLTPDRDNWYRYEARPTNSFAFAATAISRFQLENRNRPSTRIDVYQDLPPTVRVLEPSDDSAVPPDEKIDVAFEAADDFGVARAEVVLAVTKKDGSTNAITLPVELGNDAGKKDLRKTVQLDPKALGMEDGDALSLVVQVTDTRQTPAQASADQADQTDQTDQADQAQSQSRPNDPKKTAGPQPPPNDMAMRMLDVGQCTACKPRSLSIDQWAGSFDGEKRRKLEIAMAPILKSLDAHLASAQDKTRSLKPAAAGASTLTPSLTRLERLEGDGARRAGEGLPGAGAALESARGELVAAQGLIADLQVQSTNTPYAFIGLQLRNIDFTHISPAHDLLGQITLAETPASNELALLDKGDFHVTRAREMVADLTRSFQTVKRDHQVADAMQKLDKMYQIFLEDTQALLGSSKGPINTYDRKVAEVDEAFVEKLKALLEEKKAIMAELAKVLADDPRLLRRYLAMLQKQGISYRDQLTLLAEDQKKIKGQVDLWNVTPEPDRAALIPQIRQASLPDGKQVAEDATRLRENMETWLPLDVKTGQPQVQAALNRAEKIAQWTAESAAGSNPAAAEEALEALRQLRDQILQFTEIPSTNQARMGAYVANRLPEIDALLTAHSGQMKIAESLNHGDFAKIAEIVQQRVTEQTVALGEKLEASEAQLSGMSKEIADKANELDGVIQDAIIVPQRGAVDRLARREMPAAGEVLVPVVPAFARAETTFDELIQLVIAKLDDAPPPDDAGRAQDLESILALLQDEIKASENLGIPCRPINVSVLRDWMKPGQNSGQGMGQGQAQAQAQAQGRAQLQAARDQAQRAREQTGQLEQGARNRARQAIADARKAGEQTAADETVRADEDWNKLASHLRKDLLQGRDNTPPEQYREAIENYFRVLTGTTAPAAK